jgi:hypothetical protein
MLRVRLQAAQGRRQRKTYNHPALDTHHLPLALNLILALVLTLKLWEALKVPMTLKPNLFPQVNYTLVLGVVRIASFDSRIRPASPTTLMIKREASVAMVRPGAHIALTRAVAENVFEG